MSLLGDASRDLPQAGRACLGNFIACDLGMSLVDISQEECDIRRTPRRAEHGWEGAHLEQLDDALAGDRASVELGIAQTLAEVVEQAGVADIEVVAGLGDGRNGRIEVCCMLGRGRGRKVAGQRLERLRDGVLGRTGFGGALVEGVGQLCVRRWGRRACHCGVCLVVDESKREIKLVDGRRRGHASTAGQVLEPQFVADCFGSSESVRSGARLRNRLHPI